MEIRIILISKKLDGQQVEDLTEVIFYQTIFCSTWSIFSNSEIFMLAKSDMLMIII